MKRQPYVADPETGASVTRQFVEAFLERYNSPIQEGSITIRSVCDILLSTVKPPQEVLYEPKAKNSLKRYIGRASPVHDSRNTDEYLWCIVADVSKACRRLNDYQRKVIGLKYVLDLGDNEIAHKLGVPVTTVTDLIRTSIDVIASALDGVPC